MQIKTTIRYHLTPVRMPIVDKSTNHKCWWGCGEKKTLVHCWWDCRLVQSPWETVCDFLKRLKMELFLTQQFFCWEYTLKIPKHQFKWIYAHSSIIYNSQDLEIALVPTVDEWIKNLYIYILEYYTAVKRRNSYLSREHGWNWRVLC